MYEIGFIFTSCGGYGLILHTAVQHLSVLMVSSFKQEDSCQVPKKVGFSSCIMNVHSLHGHTLLFTKTFFASDSLIITTFKAIIITEREIA